jgi:hypothetical protein
MIATTHNGGCAAIKEVRIDGKVVKHVVYADTANGFAIVHKTDEAGRIVTKDDCIVIEPVIGTVSLVLNPDWAYNREHAAFEPVRS